MKNAANAITEGCQRIIARVLATNPAGRGLFLIGGFRYRLLDHSPRRSMDIDYHWGGVLEEKQREVISLLRRKLVPELKQRFNLEVEVSVGRGVEKQSDQVKVVEVVLSRPGESSLRIEIDVEITAVELSDPPEVRTADGVIFPTISDADMVENKVAALFARVSLQTRDFLDIFLFQNSLLPDSSARIRSKLQNQGIDPEWIKEKVGDIDENRVIYLNTLRKLIEEQLDPPAAENIQAAGGAETVLANVLNILKELSR